MGLMGGKPADDTWASARGLIFMHIILSTTTVRVRKNPLVVKLCGILTALAFRGQDSVLVNRVNYTT